MALTHVLICQMYEGSITAGVSTFGSLWPSAGKVGSACCLRLLQPV